MVGISIFPGQGKNIKKQREYLKLAKDNNFKYIFTSLHIPESNEELKEEFKLLMDYADEFGFKVIVDISKDYYDLDFIKRFSFYALRLDFGFTNSSIIKVHKEMKELGIKIHINLSTNSLQDLEEFKNNGMDFSMIEASHNYYPLVESGLSRDFVLKQNNLFKSYGIKTYGFVVGNEIKRGPVNKGLPTIEDHRELNIQIASQELMMLNTDVVLVGDSQATKEEIIQLGRLEKDKVIIEVNEPKICNKLLELRYDASENIIRFDNSRKVISFSKPIEGEKTINKFDLMIINDKNNRYKNELIIITKENIFNEMNDELNFIENLNQYEWIILNLSKVKYVEFKEKEKNNRY